MIGNSRLGGIYIGIKNNLSTCHLAEIFGENVIDSSGPWTSERRDINSTVFIGIIFIFTKCNQGFSVGGIRISNYKISIRIIESLIINNIVVQTLFSRISISIKIEIPPQKRPGSLREEIFPHYCKTQMTLAGELQVLQEGSQHTNAYYRYLSYRAGELLAGPSGRFVEV
ncbi:hypothetical protein D1AOALGA4SA_842 [Olavius algarvensis Delta 1 endosymbiont]|nr:hypothetical protein D1AOALGA4SA_842 [Olavius algarvensis Delta 1 endosymbiont]